MRPTRRIRIVAALAGVLVGGACSDLTDINTTDVVTPDALGNPEGAAALRAGAVRQFAAAFGESLGQIMNSGIITDEFFAAGPATFYSAADRRNVDDVTHGGRPHAALQRARIAAREATKALQQYAPAPADPIGHTFALVGYTELFLGETFCSGVPLGEIVDQRPVFGEPLSTTEMVERAAQNFDSALVYAAADARFVSLASVGKGRALLSLGRFPEAAAAVAAVPTTYAFTIEYSAETIPNGVFQAISVSRSATVSDREGTNGLDFVSANDPRLPTQLVGKGVDGVTDVYLFTRYNSTAAPIVLAGGIEARLIEAEALLQASDPAGALAILNELRATAITPALPALDEQSSAAAQVDQLFRERAFWLFGTGHRHADLRRLVRQYGRPTEAVFPTGLDLHGMPYGSDVTFIPDESVDNNPSFTGCISREA